MTSSDQTGSSDAPAPVSSNRPISTMIDGERLDVYFVSSAAQSHSHIVVDNRPVNWQLSQSLLAASGYHQHIFARSSTVQHLAHVVNTQQPCTSRHVDVVRLCPCMTALDKSNCRLPDRVSPADATNEVPHAVVEYSDDKYTDIILYFIKPYTACIILKSMFLHQARNSQTT